MYETLLFATGPFTFVPCVNCQTFHYVELTAYAEGGGLSSHGAHGRYVQNGFHVKPEPFVLGVSSDACFSKHLVVGSCQVDTLLGSLEAYKDTTVLGPFEVNPVVLAVAILSLLSNILRFTVIIRHGPVITDVFETNSNVCVFIQCVVSSYLNQVVHLKARFLCPVSCCAGCDAQTFDGLCGCVSLNTDDIRITEHCNTQINFVNQVEAGAHTQYIALTFCS